MEIKNIAFEKLNDLEFINTIQVHFLNGPIIAPYDASFFK
jgi:hypothetical protein